MDFRDLDKAINDVKDIESKQILMLMEIGATIKIILYQKLKKILGDKLKHFDINVSPNANNLLVEIKPNSEVGGFIASGTKSHIISSTSPMPIGGGVFSMSVQHPGTEEYGTKIQAAAMEALVEAFALAGMSR